jgi:L-histidine N-alpha-methyltransferase
MTLLSPTPETSAADRVTFTDLLPADHTRSALVADVRRGLSTGAKALPSTWFYDEHGSDLFERITELPEYYLTRTEDALLRRHAQRIARTTRARTVLEFGSGSSAKTRRVLTALHPTLEALMSIDVSASALTRAATALARDYPGLAVHAVRADIAGPIAMSVGYGPHPRLLMFLGSSVGNFDRNQRAAFLSRARAMLQPADWFLLGVDLVKDAAVVRRAYDDAAGVTAAFNRNVLTVLNRELDARFDPQDFEHIAVWNSDQVRIEMRLRARRALSVPIPGAGIVAEFDAGEDLLTEISCKFDIPSIAAELAAVDLDTRCMWSDRHGTVALLLCRVNAPDHEAPAPRVAAADSPRVSA